MKTAISRAFCINWWPRALKCVLKCVKFTPTHRLFYPKIQGGCSKFLGGVPRKNVYCIFGRFTDPPQISSTKIFSEKNFCPGKCFKPVLDVFLAKNALKRPFFRRLRRGPRNKRLIWFAAYWIRLDLVSFASQSVSFLSRTGSLNAHSKALFWHFWSNIDTKPEISRIFKYSLWLNQLTDLDSKGSKLSIM